jgi:hypothetical protein
MKLRDNIDEKDFCNGDILLSYFPPSLSFFSVDSRALCVLRVDLSSYIQAVVNEARV